jgi:hypothetical protein
VRPPAFRPLFRPLVLAPTPGAPAAPQADTEWAFVSSSNVGAVRRVGADLLVWFFPRGRQPGRTYIYYGAGAHLEPMLGAGSKGIYLDRHVKKARYAYDQIG